MTQKGRPQLSPSGKAIHLNITVSPEDHKAILKIDSNISKAIRQIVKERKEDRRESPGH